MNFLREDLRSRFPRLAINVALALIFWGTSIVFPRALSGFSKDGEFLTWIIITLVAVVFSVRALSDALALGDNAIGAFLQRLGVKEGWSRKRVLKDAAYIIAIILAAAAVSPFLGDFGYAGSVLQTTITYLALGVILLFVYDIGRTFYRIAEEKANLVADWLVQTRNEEEE